MINLKTYTESSEYRQVKGIDLDSELLGSTDESSGDADRFIFRVERKIINFLTTNYDFNESMLENENALNNFKLAVCDQVEEQLANGSNSPICGGAVAFLRRAGLMNIRRY